MSPDSTDKTNADLREERTLRIQADGDYPRLDGFLLNVLRGISRSHIQKIIKSGNITINDGTAKPSSSVHEGDSLVIVIPPPEPSDVVPEEIPLDVIYEDDSLIVINKQKNLTVHPTPNRTSGTLVNALLNHCGDSLSGIGGVLRPGIVHRLDKETSGVMVAAKSDEAHVSLSDQIKDRSVEKIYTAVVHGVVADLEGEIDAHIGRNPADRKKMAVVEKGGKRSITQYEVLERFEHFSVLSVHLLTGRTHQIRVHMSYIGHPVAGDPAYGGDRFRKRAGVGTNRRKVIMDALAGLDGQALHATRLSFMHPMTGEPMTFEAPLPDDISNFIDFLRSGGGREVQD